MENQSPLEGKRISFVVHHISGGTTRDGYENCQARVELGKGPIQDVPASCS